MNLLDTLKPSYLPDLSGARLIKRGSHPPGEVYVEPPSFEDHLRQQEIKRLAEKHIKRLHALKVKRLKLEADKATRAYQQAAAKEQTCKETRIALRRVMENKKRVLQRAMGDTCAS